MVHNCGEAEKKASDAVARAQKDPNKVHHIFDNPQHKWGATGLDRQGNWNLIRDTLVDNYEEITEKVATSGDPRYEAKEIFDTFRLTVRGALTPMAPYISEMRG